ncbi:neuronal PAS domain-containing protein 4A [Gadus chalcogrammus]|uniref:neuronal PAS domain-containing protein 4A n=1 Tax=Gadus chalcogrammus TaxID=1042646 RepID=UPI0024C47B0C|nr:neuronal PAS domain-containing protein 4A [Gadus chalcogrammus]
MYRSTKGASKARRDQINAEIRNLKDLLPITDADKARLSYLHIMSLACMYTRKSVFFSEESGTAMSLEESARFLSFHELSELVQALPGFLMLVSGEGKLLYLSDSVSDHLGHSMVDLVAQGDSVYDIIESTDHFVMRNNLTNVSNLDQDRLFRCRFNTSKSVRRQSAGNKLVLIRARCLATPPSTSASTSTSTTTTSSTYWTSNPVWVCFCSPLEPHPARSGAPGAELSPVPPPPQPNLQPHPAEGNFFLACFYSLHGRDMRLQDAQDSVSSYLGFDAAALRSHSWYSLLHPQDLSHASAQHRSLLREGGEGRAEMVVRLQAEDQSWVWLYMVLQLEAGGDSPISSNNYIISEAEAWSVRQQLSSEHTQLSLVLSTGTSQPEGLSLQSPETLSSPDQVFTPGSSGLSGQSFDFSTAGCSVGSSDEPAASGSSAAEPMQLGEGDPRSSLSSLEEDSFFHSAAAAAAAAAAPEPSASAAASPTPVTVATVTDMDFLEQNILLPSAFQLDTPLPPQPQPLPPMPSPPPQAQQTKEFVCTPPYTPDLGGASFLFGDPLFSFDPAGATTPPLTSAASTSMGTSISPSAPTTSSSSTPPPPSTTPTTTTTTSTTTLSAKLPLAMPLPPSSELLFPAEPYNAALYEKLPPTPDSPGDGDCTVMTLPEVRGPLYVDVPLGPLHYPPEGLLTPEASPGKQSGLAFFSLEREREKERLEISLLARHISTLAEGFYLDPLLSKLSPPSMSPSSCPPSPVLDVSEAESAHALGELYPIKAWRGLDVPMFLDDDESLFEENLLETLIHDFTAAPPPLSPGLCSPDLHCPSPSPSSPSSPQQPHPPACWLQPSSFFEGAGHHFCSVQSAHPRSAGEPAAGGEGSDREEPMEIEVMSSPLSSCSSIPASPPLVLTASPMASPAYCASPRGSPAPATSCTQSLLEELAVLEPMFGAGASIAPGLGQQPELYQLQCHPSPQCFHQDGSGSVSPF